MQSEAASAPGVPPNGDGEEDPISEIFRMALSGYPPASTSSDGNSHVRTSDADIMFSIMNSANRVMSQATSNPTASTSISPAQSYPASSSSGPLAVSSTTQSDASQNPPPTAPTVRLPRQNHRVTTSLQALRNLHTQINATLQQLPPVPDIIPPQTLEPPYLSSAEADLNRFNHELETLTLNIPAVAAARSQTVLALSILKSRVGTWRQRFPYEGPKVYDTGYFFDRRADTALPKVQVALLLALACKIFFGMSRKGCDVLMKFLRIFQTVDAIAPLHPMEKVPHSMEAVEACLNIEARTTAFAVCPSCHCTYAPNKVAREENVYPALCTHTRTPGGDMCYTPLLDDKRQPLKIYEYRHLDDYIAALLSRADIELEIDAFNERTLASTRSDPSPVLNGVSDGHLWRTFKGHDGNLFVDGRGEARISLALNIDYFATEGMRPGKGKGSSGVIIASCLNLPPDIRNDPANMFLVGVIPGPDKPKEDDEEHYIRPFIDDLEGSYKCGVRYTRTALHPEGRVERSAIAALVVDFPAGRQTGGYTSVSSHHFCTVCECENQSTLGRTDFENWKTQNLDRIRAYGLLWPTLTSGQRKKGPFSAESTGIRGSQLWRLPYWNPIRQLTVDPMHCIFEILCKKYTREVFRLDPEAKVQTPLLRAFYHPFRSPYLLPPHSQPYPGSQSKINIFVQFPQHRNGPFHQTLVELQKDPDSWKTHVPLIHKGLYKPVSNGFTAAERETLEKSLRTRLKNALVYVCLDLERFPLDGRLLHRCDIPDLAKLLADWRSTKPTQPIQRVVVNKEYVGERLRHVIQNTIHPSHIASVPPSVAESKEGTIKADQWKMIWLLYMPLALVSLWGQGAPQPAPDAQDMADVLENAMALSAVATIVSKRTLTAADIVSYLHMLRVHVEGLKCLFHDFMLPSHHMAFHIPDFMLWLGPVPKTWWTFQFERIIGKLERIPHNHKHGELESTMLHSFTQAGKLRQWLTRPDCSIAIAECKKLLEEIDDDYSARYDKSKFYLKACPEDLRPFTTIRDIEQTSQFYWHGVSYTTNQRHRGNSQVWLRPGNTGDSPKPVKIEHIIRRDGRVHVAVRALNPAHPEVTNPFSSFPHFDARLYSSTYSTVIELVEFQAVMGHFASYKLANDLTAVMSVIRD